MTTQKKAKLRVCMSCEWIYKGDATECPKCSWPSYGARFCYGDAAYRYAKSQKPWRDKKMENFSYKLDCEIENPK